MSATRTYPWAVGLVKAGGGWVSLSGACSLRGGQALRGQAAATAAAGSCAELPCKTCGEVLAEGATAADAGCACDVGCAAEVLVAARAHERCLRGHSRCRGNLVRRLGRCD
jgi:hypothetical protein